MTKHRTNKFVYWTLNRLLFQSFEDRWGH